MDNKRIPLDAKVTIISDNGDFIGVHTYREAKEIAEDKGLDVIILSSKENKITVKIADEGKYLYEQKKKRKEQQKKQKENIQEVKEIWIRPGIGDNDLNIKINSARKFIEKNDKVKVTLKFKGREITHSKEFVDILYNFADKLTDIAKLDGKLQYNERNISMILIPSK